MAVGDIEIQIAIIIEIEGGASPGPSGSGNLVVARKLLETSFRRCQIHAVAVPHFFAHLVVLRELIAAQSHVVQSPGGRGTHPNHIHVHFPIQVIIAESVRHPKKRSFVHGTVGDISKVPMSIIHVQIDSGIITDNHKIQIAVIIQVDERTAERAAKTFWSKSCFPGLIDKCSVTLIDQEMGSKTVI